MSDLEEELSEARRKVSTDGYPMSVGELTNMYRDGELVISPPFQRLFRWDEDQKSRLIESILIGIPLPSIFVAQDDEGRWELVDGLQRISTLLQLQGLLVESDFPPLVLRGTHYLPSLEGLVWEDADGGARSLSAAQRRDIKRSKIDVKIVQRDSDPQTKFDLFQRLNSFGSRLSNQEIRNAQLVGVNPDFANWLSDLASYEAFVELVHLPESSLKQKYDEELVLRFLYLHSMSDEEISGIRNFQEGLESFALTSAQQFSSESADHATEVFHKTFDLLASADSKIFGRWDDGKSDFKGGFLNTSFEALAIGLGYLVHHNEPHRQDLRACAIEFWRQESMSDRFATGKSTEDRLKTVVPTGRRILRK